MPAGGSGSWALLRGAGVLGVTLIYAQESLNQRISFSQRSPAAVSTSTQRESTPGSHPASLRPEIAKRAPSASHLLLGYGEAGIFRKAP